MQQHFRQISTIGFTSLVMGTWEILLTASGPALQNGGLAGLFWSMIWCHVGQLFLVLSLAEMSSMAPAAGGQYQWVSKFALRRYEMFLSYCSGWFCSVGWQARFASTCYMVAGILQMLVIHNGDDNYTYSRPQRGLMTIGIASAVSAFNIFAAGHLSIAEGLFALCHVFALVPIVVSLWVLADKNPVSNAIGNFVDNSRYMPDHSSDWVSTSLAVLVGQPCSIFILLGTDAVTHIAEEIEEADVVVPRCILWSFIGNTPLTILTLFTFVFNCGRIDVLVSKERPPFVLIFQSALNYQPAVNTFTGVIIALMFMVATSTMVATSRHLYSFGRDRAVSCSAWLGRVHPLFKVPFNAILCTVLATTVLCAVCINSSTAQHTMMCFSTASIHASYIVSLGCLILKRLRHEQLPPARWTLGRSGLWINVLALIYCTWAAFWSFWPSQSSVSLTNFNWTPVLFVLVLVVAVTMFMNVQSRATKRALSFERIALGARTVG
ncbi:amino acid transporter [Lecanosticta acicola]|uniref:Amino acid transporter n=1 Tax=Lecanosticta acicola TaxID=111012 RepID=A0AAI8Z0W8_9PEZI|nr:amino acid transporter [Lecanosticta acicola]